MPAFNQRKQSVDSLIAVALNVFCRQFRSGSIRYSFGGAGAEPSAFGRATS
jgi:hypothetical protein